MDQLSAGDIRGIFDASTDSESFYRAHIGSIRSFVRNRVSDAAEVEDICADVFCAALERFEQLRVLSDVQARRWLVHVAKLRCFRRYRSQGRQRRAYERFLAEPVATAPIPDEVYELANDRDHLALIGQRAREVIAALPAQRRRVIELSVYEGLNGPQIASELHCTPQAARLQLMRARGAFRDEYVRRFGDDPFLTRQGATRGEAMRRSDDDGRR